MNRATVEELKRLPGIGPALAQRIIEYRRQRGPFRSVEELIEVKGIGPKKLERLRPYLSVGRPESGFAEDSESGSAQTEGRVIYRWVDDKGVVHYTEFPEEIPPRYRPRAKVIPFGRKATVPPPAKVSPSPKAGPFLKVSPQRKTDILGRDLRWYMKEKERIINRINWLKVQIDENKQVMRALHGGASQARRGTRTKYGLKLGEGPILRRWAEYKRLQRINQELEKELAALEYRLKEGLYKEAAKAQAPEEILEFLKKDP